MHLPLFPVPAGLSGAREFPKHVASLASLSTPVKEELVEQPHFTEKKVQAQSHTDTF